MLRRTGGIWFRWTSAAALVVLLLVAGSPARAARELVGLKHAKFKWSAAPGPVSGYRVYLERNYAEFVASMTTSADELSVVVNGNYEEVYRVQVAAIAEDGSEGPRSDPSEYIQFKSSPGGGNQTPAPSDPDAGSGSGSDSGSGSGSGSGPGSGSQAPPGSMPDFDGDGIADLLLREASLGGTLAWVMSGGGPGLPLRLGFVPLETAIAGNGDYDGDGCADLLLRDDSTGEVSMRLVNFRVVGGGTVVPSLSADWQLVGSGDFNGNGRDDILVHNLATRKLEVWFMNGPQIQSRVSLADPFSSASWQVVGVADFSGDNLADILWYEPSTNTAKVSTFGSRLAIDRNPRLFQSGSPGDVVAVGDTDGNGLPDVVIRNRETGRMRVWFTQLDRSGPKATSSAELGAEEFASSSQAGESLADFEVQGASDFDGDGRMDLVLRDSRGSGMRGWFLDGATVREEVRFMDPGPTWVFEGVGAENPSTHR
jgi:hypothetical protein